MKILLITMYYPPLNLVPCNRFKSMVDQFEKNGHQVDIITRYYDEGQLLSGNLEIAKTDVTDFADGDVKIGNVVYTHFKSKNRKRKISSLLPSPIKGIYNYFYRDVYHYDFFIKTIEVYNNYFKDTKYDLVISSYGPPIMLLIADYFSNTLNLPVLMDFRDSYITEKDTGLHLRMKVKILMKSLRNVKGITFASPGMQSIFDLHVKLICPKRVVINGVTNTIQNSSTQNSVHLEEFEKLKLNHKPLLVHIGSLYDGQNIQFFKEAIKEASTWKQPPALLFIGKESKDTYSNNEYYWPWLEREVAMTLAKHSDALVLPVWKDRYSGFSAKLIEYLYSGSLVVCGPHPQSDLFEYLKLTPNSRILNSSNDIISFFKKFRKGEEIKLPYNPDQITSEYIMGEFVIFTQKITNI